MYIGNKEVSKVYLGNKDVSNLYIGTLGAKVNQIPEGAIQTKDSGKYLITKTGKYIIIKAA